ncbi:radical SAM/SPASM domain-containing protein [Usitatibacter palustris]|uniref:PqqA peptide cyclase n=1 Tax=Usitatibacter palustris TaxID=2732487 RepID=A0A6M4H792_9PROT|nr:radical SAM protein [Usitatibacter palustris]QJR14244.1 PqqA peptide cyclase [Usitatibacter palustris]
MKVFSITNRIDAVTRIPDRYLGATLPAPRAVKIELTSQCNYRCGFCAHRLRMKDRGGMDQAFFERVVGEMVDAGVEELGLFYIGESFMCDWLPEAIAFAKQRGIRYAFLTTNGSLATPARVRECMAAGLDSLKFSMNNADEEQFAQIAAVKAKLFRDSIANLKAAHRVREEGAYQCGLYASSIQYDGEQQEKMLALVDEIRPYVDEHYWLPLYSMGSLTTQREEELGYRPIAGNQGRIGALREPLPCWSAFTEGHVTHDGKLSACCFDAGDKWVMADLNAVPFMEGWNSAPFRELRAAHLRKDVRGTICESCVAYQ